MEDCADRETVPGWSRWILPPLRAAMIIAAILMLFLLLIGFSEITKSVWMYFSSHFSGKVPVSAAADKELRLAVMTSTVKSFEIMLLAPLPFLLIAGLTDYLRAVTGGARGGPGRRLLAEAKALWVGLLVGVFATDLLDKALKGDMHYEDALSTSVVMLLLIGYFFVLEWLTRRERKDSAP